MFVEEARRVAIGESQEEVLEERSRWRLWLKWLEMSMPTAGDIC